MKTKLHILFLALGLAMPAVSPVHAGDRDNHGDRDRGNPNPGILPPGAVFKGKTAAEWTAAWWYWVETTTDAVQMTDDTGEFAWVNNNGADGVFFLAKSWTGVPQTRFVTIPAGTPLLVPVMGMGLFGDQAYWDFAAEWSGLEPGVPGVMDWMDSFIPEMRDLSVRIDGRLVRGLENGNLHYLANTGLISLYHPDGSVYAPLGYSYEIILMLTPLKPGRHVIEMKGKGALGFETDVTYHITVLPEQPHRSGRNHGGGCDDNGESKGHKR